MEEFNKIVHPSRIHYFFYYILILIFIGLAIYFKFNKFLMWTSIIIPIIILFWTEIHHFSLPRIYISEKGLRIENKLFSKFSIDIDYVNVSSIEMHQSIIGRILNYGNLKFNSRTKTEKDMELKHIKRPFELKEEIDNLVEKAKYKK